MQPVFIFSLPRAGSTLLQRIVAAHPKVSTASEPWLLMPFLYALKPSGVFAEYDHAAARMALEDFIKTLPNREADYSEELRRFAMQLYAKAARPGSQYFLDKTPRYHLLASRIVPLFPDGKFIFLWRNPLAVAASVVETFGCGKWNIHEFKIDLYDGIDNLCETHAASKTGVCAIRYEDLVAENESAVKKVCEYLQLPFDSAMAESFSKVELKGRLGDYTGSKEFVKISGEPLDKWKRVFRNPLRKRWARGYLKWIGEVRLAQMGYSHDELLKELNAVPFSLSGFFPDLFRTVYGVFNQIFEGRILYTKWQMRRDWRKVHLHR